MGVKVKKRGKDYWLYICHHGRRKAKRIGTDEGTALEVAKKVEAKIALGEFNFSMRDTVKTFGEYAKTWIDVTVPATCKPATERNYKLLLNNHILPQFGKFPVNEINRLMVKSFLMKKAKEDYAPSTVMHMKITMAGVFGLALDDEVLQWNPAHRLGKIMRERKMQLSIDPLTREETTTLLDTFREYYPQFYPLVLTLARTGIRLGESLGLRWGDIDFHGRFIIIQRNISLGKVETPKNGKSRRVDMSMQLTEALLELKRQRKIEHIDGTDEWVFQSSAGTPLIGNHFRSRVFFKALDKAGLRRIRVHDLRHGYASQLIQAGESLAYVRDQLGHHSIQVTVDIYGHLAPEGNKAAVDRLDDDFDATKRNLYATEKMTRAAVNAQSAHNSLNS